MAIFFPQRILRDFNDLQHVKHRTETVYFLDLGSENWKNKFL